MTFSSYIKNQTEHPNNSPWQMQRNSVLEALKYKLVNNLSFNFAINSIIKNSSNMNYSNKFLFGTISHLLIIRLSLKD